jgi:1,2-phenylacetyl-CoA epoxidase catalytic subunit
MDEANHFRLVKEVVEHYNGGPIDIAAEEKIYGQREAGKGAALIEKYNVLGDPLLLAAYQYIVEGRAAVVWQTMANCSPDEFVSRRYAQIARDEKFHQNIGRLELEKLCTTPESQERVRAFLKELIWDLWEISCLSNTMPSEDIKKDMVFSYGQPHRELLVAI